MNFVRRFPIAPFLLALYGVVVLLANNIDQISGTQALRSLAISLIGTGVVVDVFILVFRNWHLATLAAALVVLLLFSYGHVYSILKQVEIFSILIGRHRFLIPLWIGLLAIGLYILSKRIQDPISLSGPMNLVGAILILVPLSTIAIFLIRSRGIQPSLGSQSLSNCDLVNPANSRAPDIYYIILDAYARADDLQDLYQFDNSEFLDDLSDMGFYVAEWSQSNYLFTQLSMSSSLNMDYLQSLDERIYAGAQYDIAPLWPLLGENVVRRNLECLGYKVVSFDSGWHALGWRDADVYIGSDSTSFAEALELSGGINAFESMLIQSSAALILTDTASLMPRVLQIDTGAPFEEHRQRMLYQLDALETIVPEIEGPKFVFAHILATHKPYLFGSDGEPIEHKGQFTLADVGGGDDSSLERAQYRDQIIFINSRINAVVRKILSGSETPPIIIIQSDHGYVDGKVQSPNILNAYFLPDAGDKHLYSTISPVNTFRIIFNQYLGGHYQLLGDTSYFSSYESSDFKEIVNEHSGG